MSFDRRVARMEHRIGSGGCPDCGHVPGGAKCATPEEIARLEVEFQDVMERLDEVMAGPANGRTR